MLTETRFGYSGFFVVFGYGDSRHQQTAQLLSQAAGCHSLTISFGPEKFFFFNTTYPDLAEDETCLVLNLGIARDRESGEILSAQDLIQRGLVTPESLAVDALSGNTTVICVSKQQPQALCFRMAVSTSVLYYHTGVSSPGVSSASQGNFICADKPHLLMPFMPRLALSEHGLISHLLFRATHGPLTNLQEMYRLEHGCSALWDGDTLAVKLTQIIHELSAPTITRLNDKIIAQYREQAEAIVGAYVKWLRRNNQPVINTLSGGVDSSVLQYFINHNLPAGEKPLTFSYAMQTPQFDMEVAYAQSASRALDTQHELIPIQVEDYPELLQSAIEALGAPVSHESMPGWLAISRYLVKHESNPRYVFFGSASDTLHGTHGAKRLLQVEYYYRLPWSDKALGAASATLRYLLPHKAYGMQEIAKGVQTLGDLQNPEHPLNAQGLFTDLALVEKYFGVAAVQAALANIRETEACYYDAKSLVEKVHALQLTALLADQEPSLGHLLQVNRLLTIHPYLDRQYMQATFAFDPHIRFFYNGRAKPIIKRILEVQTGYENVNKPKGHSGFDRDLRGWMKNGVLSEMVHAIERPAYMERKDFERLQSDPNWLTWNLLTMDLFQKRVLARIQPLKELA